MSVCTYDVCVYLYMLYTRQSLITVYNIYKILLVISSHTPTMRLMLTLAGFVTLTCVINERSRLETLL